MKNAFESNAPSITFGPHHRKISIRIGMKACAKDGTHLFPDRAPDSTLGGRTDVLEVESGDPAGGREGHLKSEKFRRSSANAERLALIKISANWRDLEPFWRLVRSLPILLIAFR